MNTESQRVTQKNTISAAISCSMVLCRSAATALRLWKYEHSCWSLSDRRACWAEAEKRNTTTFRSRPWQNVSCKVYSCNTILYLLHLLLNTHCSLDMFGMVNKQRKLVEMRVPMKISIVFFKRERERRDQQIYRNHLEFRLLNS